MRLGRQKVPAPKPQKAATKPAGLSGKKEGFVHQGTTGRSGVSWVLILSWLLICAWIGLLIASWRTGILNSSSFTSLNIVSEVIHRADSSLRGSTTASEKANEVVNNIPADSQQQSQQQQPVQVQSAVAVQAVDDADIHVIFSTDCTPFQDWQTIVLFHSAVDVGQKGPITRIASGCDDAKKVELTNLYKKLYPQYRVHFTPDFKNDEKTNKKYDFYNKPWGLKHWLEHAEPKVSDDVVVALIDPDMIFIRPLTTQIRGMDNNIYDKKHIKPEELPEKVGKGTPVAQLYGLGAPWTNDNHKKFNRGKICGEGSPCLKPNERFGSMHYSVGPPYLVQKADLERIAKSWTTFVPRVYEGYPYLLAEMYAYSMASAHEELPHLQMEHYMISNTEAPGEGWPWIDQLSEDEICAPPDDNGIYLPGKPLPTIMHFCQFYRAGELGFQKRRLPKDIFSCDSPMLAEPPSDLGKYDFRVKDDKKEKLNALQVKRNAFSLCVIHRSINAALVDFKKKMCNGTTNFAKTLNVNALNNY